MSRLRHEKARQRLAGAGSGVHRLEAGKPLPFKPEEERKHGGKLTQPAKGEGKIEGKSSDHKLGRKRGGSIHKTRATGTDATPDLGMKYGTPLQETKMSGPGNIEDSLKRGGKCGRADGGKVKWLQGAIKHPGAEKQAAKKAGESTYEYMEDHKGDSGKSGARARLGLRLSAMSKHK